MSLTEAQREQGQRHIDAVLAEALAGRLAAVVAGMDEDEEDSPYFTRENVKAAETE